MKVFISWSGETSKNIAKEIQIFMPRVMNNFSPFVSATSIEAGQQWLSELIENLTQSDFGIVCLTPENVNSPWVMFEAGALAQKLGGKGFVAPIVFEMGIDTVNTPLSIFQVKRFNKDDFYDVMLSAYNRSNEKVIKESEFKTAFEQWWPDFETNIQSITNNLSEKIEIQHDEKYSDICNASYQVADVLANKNNLLSVLPDNSDLFYILLTVLDCQSSRDIIRKICKKQFPNIFLEAMYDLQGNWDLLVKYRSDSNSDDFFKAIINELASTGMMNSELFNKKMLVDFRKQTLNIDGVMSPNEEEIIKYTLLGGTKEYMNHRAKRFFILIDTKGLIQNKTKWMGFLKALKEGINSSLGSKILESVLIADNIISLELFSSCSQSSYIDYLNAGIESALTNCEMQKYTLSCYGYDEEGLQSTTHKENKQ